MEGYDQYLGPLGMLMNNKMGAGNQSRSGLSQALMGNPSTISQAPRYNPGQMNAQQGLLQMGQQGLQNPYQGFAPIAQHARSQFNQQTVPSIAERFTSLGGQRGSNALSSPAFASQMGQAGAGLEEALASLEAQYGMQNQSNFMNMMQMGMQPQFDNFQTQEQPGMLQSMLPALGRMGMHAGSAYLTGGASAIPSALSMLLSSM
jgi:hypothetical protein